MKPDDDLVRVFTGSNIMEADIVKGLLRAHGIDAVIENEGPIVMMDGMITPSDRGVGVLVLGAKKDAATAVIEEARGQGEIERAGELE
jgi:hypothetical protein